MAINRTSKRILGGSSGLEVVSLEVEICWAPAYENYRATIQMAEDHRLGAPLYCSGQDIVEGLALAYWFEPERKI